MCFCINNLNFLSLPLYKMRHRRLDTYYFGILQIIPSIDHVALGHITQSVSGLDMVSPHLHVLKGGLVRFRNTARVEYTLLVGLVSL